MSARQDLTKEKFGKLQPIERISESRNGHVYYKCICDCGNYCNVAHSHLKSGRQKACGCEHIKRGSDSPYWKGHGGISGGWWQDHVVRSANGSKGRKQLDLNITMEYAWNLFLKQNQKCALTDLPIAIANTNIYNSASLDRIDSSEGYIVDNVQWVHKHINLMKNKFTQDYFIELCKKVAQKHEK